YTLGKRAMVLRVEFIEPLQNEFGVAFILCKDNGFTQPVAARHLDATLHQVLQHDVNGRLVEHEFVEVGGGNKVRQLTIFNEVVLIPFLVLIRQVVVGDAFLQKFGLYLVVVIRYQYVVLLNRRFVIVGVGGDAVFHLEKVVGVPVYICFR